MSSVIQIDANYRLAPSPKTPLLASPLWPSLLGVPALPGVEAPNAFLAGDAILLPKPFGVPLAAEDGVFVL